ncbi:hypothetical protein [Brucella anthropi]|uniref:hypothetical protein n=1 Tax=Brucella anthropi TaxID=529 RepID=UPI003D9695C3
MFDLLDILKMGAAVVAGAVIVSSAAHGIGVSDGKKQASADALAATVKYYQDKGGVSKISWMLLPLFALITGYETTSFPSVCAGFEKLRPSLETSVNILTTDRPFANQVTAHNRFGKQAGCWN